MADGGMMAFRNYIGYGAGGGIQELYVQPGEQPIAGVGDSVRVCMLSTPKKGDGCDPAKDVRGRWFLVINRSNRNDNGGPDAAVYTNAEHWCGGA
jgi:hypothetical protein